MLFARAVPVFQRGRSEDHSIAQVVFTSSDVPGKCHFSGIPAKWCSLLRHPGEVVFTSPGVPRTCFHFVGHSGEMVFTSSDIPEKSFRFYFLKNPFMKAGELVPEKWFSLLRTFRRSGFHFFGHSGEVVALLQTFRRRGCTFSDIPEKWF
jgi:hypothetical protein